ncbi:class A sortase [Lacicoccus alkaliphilus]|uniref:Sortase A n=1 Tax=Lacicoccus alkaliphilus DSM 16010 TaxID=1123231 RepID=A0A1M7CAI4_9BACL|nr:class A sortase [Salinicoccus alkaliphilus]SHL64193.1 sortase A [Salinicoccus alkaliphilus DSM 16010]
MRVMMRAVGVLLIGAAAVLFFWQDIQELFTDRVNERLVEAFQNGDEDVRINQVESFITGIEPASSVSADTGDGPESGINISDEMAGVLNIDSADISEPLYYGPVTEAKLRNGISFVHEGDHLDMQNIPIAGHRVEGAGIRFNYLDRASIGDTVELSTRDEVREYEITEIFNVDPSEVGVMDQVEGDPQQLTLITCDDYNPETLLFEERMIVKAEIIQ